jgi:nucleotide-binding universal stress UspA family protein
LKHKEAIMNATATKTRISLKNILYATDFSPAAESALPYAIGLAKQYGAKVHGFHVRFPATYPIVGPEAMPQIMEAAQEQAKLEAQQLHEMLAGIPHEVSIFDGEVWPLISDIVTRRKTDMIVIGTSGRTGISRVLLGSVAEEIFRRASCPVLTVGPHVSQDTERRLEMKEILYATDFSPESLAALPYAVSLAEEHQARLTLLHVVGEAKVGEFVHAEQYADSIRRQLQKLFPPEAEAWCEGKCVVEHGPEAGKIIEVATALGADLIVLGVRGAKGGIGVTTHLSGSVAHEVVTQAQCPVLTVRG